jgi:RNA polymerase sigma-70 factor (ECF subfamily)
MTMDAAPAGIDLAGMIKNHQAGVWRYLRVLGCSPAEADDLTQETFLAVLQRPFTDLGPAATAGYLRKAARNLFLSAKRRNARWVSVAELDEVEAAWSRWAGDDGGQTLLAALEVCLGTLAERARKALELRFREGRSRSEIAAGVGMSEDGAKNLLQRAKQHLRECIERRMRT